MLKLIYPAIFILFICGLLAQWPQLSGGGVQSWQLALIIVFGSFIALIIWSRGGKATTKRFHVYLCSYGLLRLRYDHSDVQVIRWEQLEKIWRRVSTYYPEQEGGKKSYSCKYTIQRDDGIQFIFEGTSDLKDFGEIIEEEVIARFLPHVVELYDAGEPITFGKLTLSQQGVSNGKQYLSWDEITSIELIGDTLLINAWQQRGFAMRVLEIPNVCVLEALIERYHIDGKQADLAFRQPLDSKEQMIWRRRRSELRKRRIARHAQKP